VLPLAACERARCRLVGQQVLAVSEAGGVVQLCAGSGGTSASSQIFASFESVGLCHVGGDVPAGPRRLDDARLLDRE
jgi:hypothetical protein